VTSYKGVQKEVKWGNQKEVSRGREPFLYNRGVAGKGSKVE